MNQSLRGKDLLELGYKQGPAISLALEAMKKMKHVSNQERLSRAADVLAHPEAYRQTPDWGKVVEKLFPPKSPTEMRPMAVPVEIYGAHLIEEGALNQIFASARLPVSYRAALMPDAHQGYGLPIGGVLATENAVIPYGVGVDIGCRMALTIYEYADIDRHHRVLVNTIENNTFFGAGKERPALIDHPVLDDPAFHATPLLRSLRDKAARQIGTSGSGNHFVEWGILEIKDNNFDIPKGRYLGLLSHSGSRGLGARIASHYTQLAKKLRQLQGGVANLAWFTMDEGEGQEYWEAMNLAGNYAKANHDIIHQTIAKELRMEPLLKIENHHNFAWKEVHDGKDVIVHRKGATPAGSGVLGIIPGSMATPGYVVRGKGNEASLNSASHGSGRVMSRSKAKQTFVWGKERHHLIEQNIHLLGGGIDEIPKVYKDIDQVMESQRSLVETVAKFQPRIVRMAGSEEEPED